MRHYRSIVALYNQALAWLGGEQLSTIESSWEETTLGRLCHNNFPRCLEEALSEHNWSFALARQELSPKTQTLIDPQYPHRAGLPTPCLRPLAVYPSDGSLHKIRFVLEGQDILTDYAPAFLIFTQRLDDPSRWSPQFFTAMSWSLAAVLAAAKNNDVKKLQFCLENYKVKLAEAAAQDSQSQKPYGPGSPWMEARNWPL